MNALKVITKKQSLLICMTVGAYNELHMYDIT